MKKEWKGDINVVTKKSCYIAQVRSPGPSGSCVLSSKVSYTITPLEEENEVVGFEFVVIGRSIKHGENINLWNIIRAFIREMDDLLKENI